MSNTATSDIPNALLHPVRLAEYKAKRDKKITQHTRIHFLTSGGNTLECRICKAREVIPCSDAFVPRSVLTDRKDGKVGSKVLKTNKDAARYFLDKHYISCIKDFGEKS